MSRVPLPTVDDVLAAAERLAGQIRHTPVIHSDRAVGPALKCENLQRTNAFKFRGVYNRVATLPAQERARGIVMVSAGNAGAAAALVARLHQVPCTVFLPENPVPAKLQAIRAFGAMAVRVPGSVDQMFHEAREFCAAHGAVLVHPVDDAQVIAGQGTVALEVLDQFPEVETLVVPSGGGGLAAGCAVVVTQLRPDVRLVVVEAEGAAKLQRSLAAGQVMPRQTISTIADGLAYPGYGALNFDIIKNSGCDVVEVSDDEILRGMAAAWRDYGVCAEPSGAAGLAATRRRPELGHERTVAIVSGGNVRPELFARCVAEAEDPS